MGASFGSAFIFPERKWAGRYEDLQTRSQPHHAHKSTTHITGLTTILGNSPVLAFAVQTYPIVWFRQRVRANVAVATQTCESFREVIFPNDVKVRGLMRQT